MEVLPRSVSKRFGAFVFYTVPESEFAAPSLTMMGLTINLSQDKSSEGQMVPLRQFLL